jgi:hypothetical protein
MAFYIGKYTESKKFYDPRSDIVVNVQTGSMEVPEEGQKRSWTEEVRGRTEMITDTFVQVPAERQALFAEKWAKVTNGTAYNILSKLREQGEIRIARDVPVDNAPHRNMTDAFDKLSRAGFELAHNTQVEAKKVAEDYQQELERRSQAASADTAAAPTNVTPITAHQRVLDKGRGAAEEESHQVPASR